MSDSIAKTVYLAAGIDRVWQALTDPAEFGAWFGMKPETPFIPGEIAWGMISYKGYEHLRWEVLIVTMDRPRMFSFRWHPYAIDPSVDYSDEPMTLVEFSLASEGSGTRLDVLETGFDAIPAHRRADAFRMNDSGWAEQMVAIEAYLER